MPGAGSRRQYVNGKKRRSFVTMPSNGTTEAISIPLCRAVVGLMRRIVLIADLEGIRLKLIEGVYAMGIAIATAATRTA
jgi:hypothetical protein